MNAARFFVDGALDAGLRIELPDAIAHHALRVLRLRDGADIVLFNGSGGEFIARLIVDRASVRAEILSHDPVERESPLAITLVQAWIGSDKLDWVVEKSVELGVNAIVVSPARRSVVRLQAERLPRRIEHLREVAKAACCQCGRNRLVEVTAAADLNTALRAAVADGRRGVLLDPASAVELADAADSASYALAVGPEGGFDAEEAAAAARLGFQGLRLGPRVLRTETAALAAIATLQAAAGDFGALRVRR